MRGFIILALLLWSAPSFAFQFSNGTSKSCVIATQSGPYSVPETFRTPLPNKAEGWTAPAPPTGRPVIELDKDLLGELVPIARDFIFYRECAYAKFGGTSDIAKDAVLANCEGLRAMRDDGMINRRGETTLQTHRELVDAATNPFGYGFRFWGHVLNCAKSPSVAIPATYP